MMNKNSIILIGRFDSQTGYSFTTTSLYFLFKKNDYRVIGIDHKNLAVYGKTDNNIKISKDKGILNVSNKNLNSNVTLILNFPPSDWNKIKIFGNVTVVGFPFFEVSDIPLEYQESLDIPNLFWVASNYNFEILKKYTSKKINQINLPLVSKFASGTNSALNIDSITNNFKILSVVSNWNRKDIGSVIKSYLRAFSVKDSTTLILKIPKLQKTSVNKFIAQSVYPEFNLNDKNIPHILVIYDHLNDEEMNGLYSQVDCYVSCERAKGFDLPSAQAMYSEVPTVGIKYSANTDFMNNKNSFLIEPNNNLIHAEDSHYNPGSTHLYSGSEWASFSIDEVSQKLKYIYKNQKNAKKISKKGSEYIKNNYSDSSALKSISESFVNIKDYESYSYHKSSISISNFEILNKEVLPKFTRYKNLSTKYVRSLDEKPANSDLLDFIEKRKKIFSKFGTIMPPEKEQRKIKQLENKFLGEEIFIVGNGPSLTPDQLNLIKSKYSFGVNRISLMFEKTSWRPNFYTTLDWLTSVDNFQEYNSLEIPYKFFPMRFWNVLDSRDNTYWYESTSSGFRLDDSFGTTFSDPIRGAGTVTTAAIQIAWILGFRKFYLLGCDASYKINDTVKESGEDRFGNGNKLILQSSLDDDPNHFSKEYFGQNKYWHNPNVPEMKRGFYRCKQYIENNNGEIYDCTLNGKLDFFKKKNLEEVIHNV